MNQNMVVLGSFLGDDWCAYLVNMYWLMCDIILGVVVRDFKLSLALLLIQIQRKNSLSLIVDGFLQFLYLSLLFFHF